MPFGQLVIHLGYFGVVSDKDSDCNKGRGFAFCIADGDTINRGSGAGGVEQPNSANVKRHIAVTVNSRKWTFNGIDRRRTITG